MNKEVVLEGPISSVGMTEVIDSCSFCCDTGVEGGNDCFSQPFAVSERKFSSLFCRVQAGSKQCFIGVDVTDSCN